MEGETRGGAGGGAGRCVSMNGAINNRIKRYNAFFLLAFRKMSSVYSFRRYLPSARVSSKKLVYSVSDDVAMMHRGEKLIGVIESGSDDFKN